MDALYVVDLQSPPVGTVQTIEDLIAALKRRADETPKDQWVVGRGYDQTLLREKRHPTREDLDKASTDHPISKCPQPGYQGQNHRDQSRQQHGARTAPSSGSSVATARGKDSKPPTVSNSSAPSQ